MISERINKLRQAMKNNGIDVYYVPTNDFHGSEYVGDYFKCRKWGFAKDYSEDNYMICSFLLAYEKQIKEKAKSIVCGCYPYTDEQVNKFASHKLKEIVEPILKHLK